MTWYYYHIEWCIKTNYLGTKQALLAYLRTYVSHITVLSNMIKSDLHAHQLGDWTAFQTAEFSATSTTGHGAFSTGMRRPRVVFWTIAWPLLYHRPKTTEQEVLQKLLLPSCSPGPFHVQVTLWQILPHQLMCIYIYIIISYRELLFQRSYDVLVVVNISLVDLLQALHILLKPIFFCIYTHIQFVVQSWMSSFSHILEVPDRLLS